MEDKNIIKSLKWAAAIMVNLEDLNLTQIYIIIIR